MGQTAVVWQSQDSKIHVPNQCSMLLLWTFVFFHYISYLSFMTNAPFYEIYIYILSPLSLSEAKLQGISYLFKTITL